MVVQTNPFINIDEEFSKVYGSLVARLGQFERIMLNLVKRCDQALSKKSLNEIYAEYGFEPLGTFVKGLEESKMLKSKTMARRTIDVPKEYSLYKAGVEGVHDYRNKIIHSYYSQEQDNKITVRYVEKNKGTEEITLVQDFIAEAKNKCSEIYDLMQKLDGLKK